MRYGKVLVTLITVVVLLLGYLCVNRLMTSTAQSDTVELLTKQQPLQLTTVASRNEYGFRDLAFVDGNKVWAVGYDGHNPQRMYYSEDAGLNWKAKTILTGGFTLTSVTFITAQEGWAVGNGGTILHTRNGGETWEQIKRPTDSDLNEVQFATSHVGYIAAMTEWGHEILRTVDGGQNWQKVYEDPKGGYVFQMALYGEKIAVAAINDDHLIRTEDGGVTWKTVDATLLGAASVIFTTDGTGWLVGKKGSFYRSIDQGRTWQIPNNLPKSLLNHDWSSIEFSDEKEGVAVGANGAIVVTYDGGTTWSETNAPNTDNLGLIRLHDGNGVVLGSQKIYGITLAFGPVQR